MKSLFADGAILLYGPYVIVAPDLVTGFSIVKASTFSGVVYDIMFELGDLCTMRN
jgi:hypothetical protein